MRTAQDYIDLMKHGITSRPSSLLDLWGVLNDAGRALFRSSNRAPYFHRWTWASRASTTLVVPVNVSEIPLPLDFVREVSVKAVGLTNVVVVETLGTLNDFKAANQAGNSVLRICFNSGIKQPTPTQPTRRFAAIYPTLSVERSDIYLTYEADWRDLVETRPDEIPNIPASHERLMYLMARDFAWGLQNQRPSYESVEMQAELERLVIEDSDRQDTDGQPVHSVRRSALGDGFDRNSRIRVNEITRA